MNFPYRAGILSVFLAAVAPAQAADNLGIERLATCQDSWFEWKSSDPARLQKFVASIQSDFLRQEREAFFVPKSSQSVAGLPVTRVFPQSVGMRVGFSVIVDASIGQTRTSLTWRGSGQGAASGQH